MTEEARTRVPEEAEPLCLLPEPVVVVAVETPWIAIPMRMTMPATWMRTPMKKSLKPHPMGKRGRSRWPGQKGGKAMVKML